MLGVSFGLSEVDGFTIGLGLGLAIPELVFSASFATEYGSSVGGGGISSLNGVSLAGGFEARAS